MDALKDLFSHKRTWAMIIALVFQALAPLLHLVAGDPNLAYIVDHLPIVCAGLWTVLVLGQAYEDRITHGATSALTVTRDPEVKAGGVRFALFKLLANDGFMVTFFGTVAAVVALCVPWWTGLAHLQEVFTRLADVIAMIAAALTASLKYSAAHSLSE